MHSGRFFIECIVTVDGILFSTISCFGRDFLFYLPSDTHAAAVIKYEGSNLLNQQGQAVRLRALQGQQSGPTEDPGPRTPLPTFHLPSGLRVQPAVLRGQQQLPAAPSTKATVPSGGRRGETRRLCWALLGEQSPAQHPQSTPWFPSSAQ